MGDARNFKNWLLNAWKCTQMALHLYYLIIGAPVGGWIVPAFLKFGFQKYEMYSNDIVSLFFDHRSPRWRMGSA